VNQAARRRFLIGVGALLGAPLAKAQQPAKRFRIGVLQTVRELGLKLPPSILVRADRVIE